MIPRFRFNRLTVILLTLLLLGIGYLSYIEFYPPYSYFFIGACILAEILVLVLRWG